MKIEPPETLKPAPVSSTPGLRRLRKNAGAPLTKCENCKCSRYGACGCMKKTKGE